MSSTKLERDRQAAVPIRNFINTRLVQHYGKVQPLTADRFLEIWQHYDVDGNRFLEGEEIDGFLKDFLNSALSKAKTRVSDDDARQLKGDFLERFDLNKDGKISIVELSHMLPAKERFYLLYRLENKSERGVDWMTVWKKYDRDLSGFIELDELQVFLRDLIYHADSNAEVDQQHLDRYTKTIMELFDTNQDGKLELSEMVHLLPSDENFVQLVLDKAITLDKLYATDVELLLKRYDKDNSGTLEGPELYKLMRDVLAAQTGREPNAQDVHEVKDAIMKGCDLDANGRINVKELSVILLAIANSSRKDREGGEPNGRPLTLIDRTEAVKPNPHNWSWTVRDEHDAASANTGDPQDGFTQKVKLVRKNLHISSYMPQ